MSIDDESRERCPRARHRRRRRAGFPAGGVAHCLVDRTVADVLYLEVGDRTPGDSADYPSDDLEARLAPDGRWRFFHKDGRSYRGES
jgi:uncharacterized cupin superfamily protein